MHCTNLCVTDAVATAAAAAAAASCDEATAWCWYLWKAKRRRMSLNINARFIAVSPQYFSQCDWGHSDLALMKLATGSFP